jgi:hypothetical protein
MRATASNTAGNLERPRKLNAPARGAVSPDAGRSHSLKTCIREFLNHDTTKIGRREKATQIVRRMGDRLEARDLEVEPPQTQRFHRDDAWPQVVTPRATDHGSRSATKLRIPTNWLFRRRSTREPRQTHRVPTHLAKPRSTFEPN